MAKPSQKSKKQKEDKDIAVAKYGFRSATIVAIISLVGTALTAYFGYLSNRELITKIEPTPTIISLSTLTFAPAITPALSPTVTSTNTAILPSFYAPPENSTYEQDPSSGYFITYPVCNCSYNLISQSNTFLVRLRWGAKTAELAENGADQITYSLVVDGKTVLDINSYRKSPIFISDPVLKNDIPESWWVYWDYPITSGQYGGTHLVEVEMRTLTEIDNGWTIIPAGFIEKFQTSVNLSLIQLYPTRKP